MVLVVAGRVLYFASTRATKRSRQTHTQLCGRRLELWAQGLIDTYIEIECLSVTRLTNNCTLSSPKKGKRSQKGLVFGAPIPDEL